MPHYKKESLFSLIGFQREDQKRQERKLKFPLKKIYIYIYLSSRGTEHCATVTNCSSAFTVDWVMSMQILSLITVESSTGVNFKFHCFFLQDNDGKIYQMLLF